MICGSGYVSPEERHPVTLAWERLNEKYGEKFIMPVFLQMLKSIRL
jgi:hypothetical protein